MMAMIMARTVSMAAMGEGFAVRAMEGLEHPVYHAAEDDDVPTGEWTLFALGVRALVSEFMTPVATETPRTAG